MTIIIIIKEEMKRTKGSSHTKSIQRNFIVSYWESILYPRIALLYKKGGTLHQVRLTTGQLIYLLKSGTNLIATCKHNIPSILERRTLLLLCLLIYVEVNDKLCFMF
jgi:hypothetical protein